MSDNRYWLAHVSDNDQPCSCNEHYPCAVHTREALPKARTLGSWWSRLLARWRVRRAPLKSLQEPPRRSTLVVLEQTYKQKMLKQLSALERVEKEES